MKKAINKKYILTIIIGVLAAMLVTLIVILAISYGGDDVDEPYIARQVKEVDIDPGYDLQVEKIGAYSGIYMEDGSDEKVTDVLMVHVKNRGNKPIQYAEITLKGEKATRFLSYQR